MGYYTVKLYEPRGACEELFYCCEPAVLLEGPAGTGKSRAVLEKVKYLCQSYRDLRILLVRKTRESMSETVLATWENHVIPSDLISGDARRNNRQHYDMPNNNVIVIGGMDKPSKIMSSDYDVICAFEATELNIEDYENLTTRLRNNKLAFQQIICDCNPGVPGHFLNKKANNGEMVRLISRHTPTTLSCTTTTGTITEMGKEYFKKLGALSGARKQRLLLGNWAAADNLVYESFDPDIHVIDRYDEPFSHYVMGVDWGYRDPGVFQVWGVDYKMRSVLVYEIFRSYKDMDFWRKRATLIHKKYRLKRAICDHDPEKIQQLTRIGLPAMKAKKDIDMGISVVQARLQPREDGKPMIMFMRNARKIEDQAIKEMGIPTQTIDEFYGYAYPDLEFDRNQDEKPIDLMNHGMDTMRYVQVHIDRFASAD